MHRYCIACDFTKDVMEFLPVLYKTRSTIDCPICIGGEELDVAFPKVCTGCFYDKPIETYYVIYRWSHNKFNKRKNR